MLLQTKIPTELKHAASPNARHPNSNKSFGTEPKYATKRRRSMCCIAHSSPNTSSAFSARIQRDTYIVFFVLLCQLLHSLSGSHPAKAVSFSVCVQGKVKTSASRVPRISRVRLAKIWLSRWKSTHSKKSVSKQSLKNVQISELSKKMRNNSSEK